MIHTVFLFAEGIDERKWEKVRQTLAGTVFLDSSAMGRPSRELTAAEFIAYMQSASGAFQTTCHHVGNFRRQQVGVQGEVVFDLMALHYQPGFAGGECWCLFRKMKALMHLDKNGQWEMTGIQTQVEQATGNLQLMEQGLKSPHEHLPPVPGRNTDLVDHFFTALMQSGVRSGDVGVRSGDAGIQSDDAGVQSGDEGFGALWAEDATWAMPFSSRTLSGKAEILAHYRHIAAMPPLSYFWTFRNTQNLDITLVAYEMERPGSGRRTFVSAAIFYFKDRLLWRVEDYAEPMAGKGR
ncbi:MAG TPA: nuclear transport factor 2 family protein [Cyclobacteriaceae bacterium]|nr:nuclear transport factor 2 family protein [Cyclobacteriaceae bacterium]